MTVSIWQDIILILSCSFLDVVSFSSLNLFKITGLVSPMSMPLQKQSLFTAFGFMHMSHTFYFFYMSHNLLWKTGHYINT